MPFGTTGHSGRRADGRWNLEVNCQLIRSSRDQGPDRTKGRKTTTTCLADLFYHKMRESPPRSGLEKHTKYCHPIGSTPDLGLRAPHFAPLASLPVCHCLVRTCLRDAFSSTDARICHPETSKKLQYSEHILPCDVLAVRSNLLPLDSQWKRSTKGLKNDENCTKPSPKKSC